jgi:hypothetical protein
VTGSECTNAKLEYHPGDTLRAVHVNISNSFMSTSHTSNHQHWKVWSLGSYLTRSVTGSECTNAKLEYHPGLRKLGRDYLGSILSPRLDGIDNLWLLRVFDEQIIS